MGNGVSNPKLHLHGIIFNNIILCFLLPFYYTKKGIFYGE